MAKNMTHQVKWELRAWAVVAFLIAAFCIHDAIYRGQFGWPAIIAMISQAAGGFLAAIDVLTSEDTDSTDRPLKDD